MNHLLEAELEIQGNNYLFQFHVEDVTIQSKTIQLWLQGLFDGRIEEFRLSFHIVVHLINTNQTF